MVTYRPSADRVEYSTMTDAAKKRYADEQARWQALFEQRITRRDVSEYMNPSPAARGEDAAPPNPFQMPGYDGPEVDFGPRSPLTGDDTVVTDLRDTNPPPPGIDFGPGIPGPADGQTEPIELTYGPDAYRTRDDNNPLDADQATEDIDVRSEESIKAWETRIRDAQIRAKQALNEEMFAPNPVWQTAGYKTTPTPSAREVAAAAGKDMVFLGWESNTYGGGGAAVKPILMNAESLQYWDNLPPEYQDQVMALTYRYYRGQQPTFSWIEKRWNKAVAIAQDAFHSWGVYKTPFEAYEEEVIKKFAEMGEKKRTGGGGGYGSYGGGGGGRIALTSPSDALYLLNQVMTQYLGREATEEELREFVDALNAQERANPTNVTFEGGSSVQSGGFNPAIFAQRFARSQEGSAEFVATTSFLDAFLDMVGGRIGE